MEKIGGDLGTHRPNGLDAVADLRSIIFVITVCAWAEAECPQQFSPASVRLAWPFDDPAQAAGSEKARLETFHCVRDEIDARIRTWLKAELPPGWIAR